MPSCRRSCGPRPRRPRSAATFVAVSLMALALSACAGGDDSAERAASGPRLRDGALESDPTTGRAEVTEALAVAVDEDIGPLNIFASHVEPITELVYDKLLAPSPYVADPRPWLAEDVREIDPSTWEVDLREDVRWHDGELFDAADVVFTVEYFKSAPTGRWTHHVSDVPTISRVLVPEKGTVRFECAFPCPDLAAVTLADLPIIPEHVWDGIDPDDAKKVALLPVGTGPYRLVDYEPGRGYRFEANPDYFAGRPRVAELDMPIITDPSAAFTALRSGQVDATTHHVPPELIDRLAGSDGPIEVIKTAPFQFPHVVLNYRRAPFDEPDARLAVSRAMDYEQLLATVFLGKGRVAEHGYAHPDTPFANPEISTFYDPEQARDLLAGLGYTDTDGDGTREGENGPLSVEMIVDGARPVQVRGAELAAEYLTEVGIDTGVRVLEAGTFAARNEGNDYDLKVSRITAHGIADPMQFIMSHRSGYLWDAETPYPAWDALFADWKDETTLDGRTEVLQQMQELEASAPVAVPLFYPDEYWAVDAEAYDGWVESPGYGVVHKWSFLPADVSADAGALVRR